MNKVLDLVQAARASSAPGPILYSDHMLIELLALHEEMIGQLRLERMEAAGNAAFLSGMIDQHEKTAAMIRAKLDGRSTEPDPEGEIVITGEASSEALRSRVTTFAQGVRGAATVQNKMTVKGGANGRPLP